MDFRAFAENWYEKASILFLAKYLIAKEQRRISRFYNSPLPRHEAKSNLTIFLLRLPFCFSPTKLLVFILIDKHLFSTMFVIRAFSEMHCTVLGWNTHFVE